MAKDDTRKITSELVEAYILSVSGRVMNLCPT